MHIAKMTSSPLPQFMENAGSTRPDVPGEDMIGVGWDCGIDFDKKRLKNEHAITRQTDRWIVGVELGAACTPT